MARASVIKSLSGAVLMMQDYDARIAALRQEREDWDAEQARREQASRSAQYGAAARRAAGRASTLLTGPSGVAGDSARRTLLGG